MYSSISQGVEEALYRHPCRKTARRKAALRNIVDERTALAKEKAAAEKQAKTAKPSGPNLEEVPRALHRFYKKTVI